jgi:AcrR family transcriptional regulator
MDMVAKKLGLSKSSLYVHCKNKKDMLRRLFITEFKRIIEYARQGIKLSDNTAEQLYLGIYSITIYMRSRPEILVAMNWLRTRKLDIGKPEKKIEIFRLFEDINIESLQDATEEEKQRVSHWILFLLINILSHPNPFTENTRLETQNNDIRVLYKFITLGLGGFIR